MDSGARSGPDGSSFAGLTLMAISVLISTYNRAALLEGVLQSLRRQDFRPDDEVIVVDNGSTDHTSRILARAASDFPAPLRHFRETTPGKTAAMIAGLRVATGDVVALTDDDVHVADDWLAAIRQIFDDPTVALVGGRVDPLWERPAPAWLWAEGDEEAALYGALSSPLALLHYGAAQELGSRTAVGANMAVRRQVIEALGGFRPDLGRHRGTLLGGEDHDFCQRAVAAGYRCEYRPELRVRHHVPAERTRLRYFTRWFFWSGATEAILESHELATGTAKRAAHRHYLRRLVLTSAATVGRVVTGRWRDAINHAMGAAYAAGYLAQRMKLAIRGAVPRRVRSNQLPPEGGSEQQGSSKGKSSESEERASHRSAAAQQAGVHG